MIWKKIIIDTTNEATDIVASVLFDNNICGVEIEDSENLTDEELKKMYVDIPVIKVNDGKAKVIFYVSICNNDYDTKNKNSYTTKNSDGVVNDFVDESYKPSNDNVFTINEFENIIVNVKKELQEYRNFVDMGTLNISEEELDDKNFLNKWKENFKKIDIENISIIPSWEDKKNCCDDKKIYIYIEPGSAFGTGQHITTKLCVKAMKKIIDNNYIDMKNARFLDIGCGSGILGIVANKLGISKVNAIDIDETVEENLLENLKINNINNTNNTSSTNSTNSISCISSISSINNINIKNSFEYCFGNLLVDEKLQNEMKKEKNDIVVANILAPVIISLVKAGKVDEYIKENGFFICSGIIDEKEKDVINAFTTNKNLQVIDILREEGWIAVVAKKCQVIKEKMFKCYI